MGSESLKCTWIFFKDKKNEIKGPYTERQVQEWYREGWFESSFPFYFLEQGSSPDDSSCSFTLDELCARNGIGAPFSLPCDSFSSEKIRAQTEQKLDSLEEEIRSLRVKCEDVLRVKERLGKIEEKIKSLPTLLLQSTNVVAASGSAGENKKTPKIEKRSVEQRDKKREAELSEFNKWSDFYSDFYIAYLDANLAKDFKKIFQDFKGASAEHANEIMAHEEMRSMVIEKIIEKVKKRECFDCPTCPIMAYNYKQWFIHSAHYIHLNKVSIFSNLSAEERHIFQISINLAYNIGEKFRDEEEIFSKEIAKKYASVSLDESRMQSIIGFADYFNKHGRRRQLEVCGQIREDGRGDAIALRTTFNGEVKAGAFMTIYLRETGLAAELVAEIDAHIGTGLTYCLDCKLVTGTREEYYKHLMTYSHLIRPLREHTLFPSIVVNVHRTDLID